MTKYGMAIDTGRCFGCGNCVLACKSRNNLPEDVLWNRVKTVGSDVPYLAVEAEDGSLSMDFYTLACQHCDKPACVEECPTGASSKRDDGIVVVDWETCIGCDSCIEACPYQGVRTHVDSPSFYLDFSTGDQDIQQHRDKVVEKCMFCYERVDRGERPACVDVCRAQARYFGDLDDPNSEISKVLSQRSYFQLNGDAGTSPNVYFLKR